MSFYFGLIALPAALPATEHARSVENEHNSHQYEQKEADNIQAVVLDPVKIMGGWSQVFSASVSQHKLGPEHGQVQRLDRTVFVYRRQLGHSLLVAARQKTGQHAL